MTNVFRFAFTATVCLTWQAAIADQPIKADSVLLRVIDQAEIPARVAGPLVQIQFHEGQRIAKGAVVALVDDVDARLFESRAKIDLELAEERAASDIAVRSARAALAFAKGELERLKTAAKANPRSISESEIDGAIQKSMQAELDLEKAEEERKSFGLMKRIKQNDVELSQRQVELCKVKAPQAGVVKQVFKKLGEWVEPGDSVIHIVRLDRLRAEGFVHASELTADLKGSSVTVVNKLPGRGTQQFSGKVVFVASEIDPVNSQVRIWAEIENRGQLLRPGMKVEMSILPQYAKTEAPGAGASRKRR